MMFRRRLGQAFARPNNPRVGVKVVGSREALDPTYKLAAVSRLTALALVASAEDEALCLQSLPFVERLGDLLKVRLDTGLDTAIALNSDRPVSHYDPTQRMLYVGEGWGHDFGEVVIDLRNSTDVQLLRLPVISPNGRLGISMGDGGGGYQTNYALQIVDYAAKPVRVVAQVRRPADWQPFDPHWVTNDRIVFGSVLSQ
jgi:hypothetical protein